MMSKDRRPPEIFGCWILGWTYTARLEFTSKASSKSGAAKRAAPSPPWPGTNRKFPYAAAPWGNMSLLVLIGEKNMALKKGLHWPVMVSEINGTSFSMVFLQTCNPSEPSHLWWVQRCHLGSPDHPGQSKWPMWRHRTWREHPAVTFEDRKPKK